MIRTLVVDDDYRVARIHAAHIGRVQGYECVGEAHTAAEARDAVARLEPDLLLLDVYLPDEDGIALLRSLRETHDVDAIIITAARDVATVRAAMRGGAVYYLVKPFGFDQLTAQLAAYRRWRTEAESRLISGQNDVDALFAARHAPTPAPTSRGLPPTMQKVLDAVRSAERPLGAQDVSELIGISRPTAQRYLSELERKGRLELTLEYGTTGRPVNTYVVRPGA
ncbi:response regulator transcription factor [Sinomonas humi]|uniref:Transcriptional regulatory protein n=1 Tax=Sinomonas humi TaxID=1338436 RepID=A0A0B2AKB0_9MICC|nr:response regulator [Sinomonas humi]KHL04035.1 chemotaxis protein CheY [Sinomonas humi]